jgi:hypothetical protein
MKLILLLIIIVFLLILRLKRERLYFIPSYDYNNNYPEINIDNHYAIFNKKNSKKCLLISHGNYSNIYNSGSYMINKIKNCYDGDIYCYEYQGFGKCKGNISIKGCVNEHLFWLDYLSKKYDNIDLWGFSIGGGVIGQTIYKIHKSISNKINKIYFHNTFMSIKNVLAHLYPIYYLFSIILLVNDFNTYESFKNDFYKDKEIIFIHAKKDNIVPYNEAIKNYNKCLELKYNTKLIDICGNHIHYNINNI